MHHRCRLRRDHHDRGLRDPAPGFSPGHKAADQLARSGQGLCDSALHACVVAWDDTVPEQLSEMAAAGIGTVKMFTTYRDETMADAARSCGRCAPYATSGE